MCLHQTVMSPQGDRNFPISALTQSTAAKRSPLRKNAVHCGKTQNTVCSVNQPLICCRFLTLRTGTRCKTTLLDGFNAATSITPTSRPRSSIRSNGGPDLFSLHRNFITTRHRGQTEILVLVSGSSAVWPDVGVKCWPKSKQLFFVFQVMPVFGLL